MGLPRILGAFFGLLGASFMSGCFTYVPVDRPSPGSTVRIHVPVRSAIARPNQAPEFISMEGMVISAADSVILEVSSRREIGAFREIRSVDTLRVARADLSAVDTRVFSLGKSIGLGIAIAGVTAVLAAVAFGLEGGSSGNDGSGNGNTTGSSIRINPTFSALLDALSR